MGGLLDLFDQLYTEVLECTVKDLDNFTDKATDEQINALNENIFKENKEEAKKILNEVLYGTDGKSGI